VKKDLDYHVKQVRSFTALVLVGTIVMTLLTLIVGPWGFENWYLALYFMGCLGALITAALVSIDKRLRAIEKKLGDGK